MMAVPDSFRRYGSAVGDRGLARIELQSIGGRTVISQLRTRAPLLVQKALYPDSTLPGMAHVYVMSSSGGVLHGDRMEIKLVAGADIRARITTQAATKIYKMNKGFATQSVSITVGKDSYLEFLPLQIIPFRSSKFYQTVDIQSSRNATVVYSETIAAGRTAYGEHFNFDICYLKMRGRDDCGKIIFSDAAKMEPVERDMDWLFGGKIIWSTLYVITPNFGKVKREVTEVINARSKMAGCSVLPRDCGLVIRMLDDSIDAIREMIDSVAGIVRRYTLESSS